MCCGDSFFIKTTEEYLICALADGLGSGERANESSAAISSLVEKNDDKDVEDLMKLCNEELRDKRGATVSILKVDFKKESLPIAPLVIFDLFFVHHLGLIYILFRY